MPPHAVCKEYRRHAPGLDEPAEAHSDPSFGSGKTLTVPTTTLEVSAFHSDGVGKVSSTARRSRNVPDQRKGKRRSRMTIIALVAILAAGAATHVAWRWWNATRFIETTNDAQVQADITVVSSRLQGYVTRLYVTDNQRVRVGDVMATVDSRELAERAQQAHERVQ